LKTVSKNQNNEFLAFRTCKVYGPGDSSHAYGPTAFLEAIVAGERVTLFGDGEELRDHLLISDLVDIVKVMSLGDHNGVFNLASGESRSFNDIVNLARNISGYDFEIISRKRTKPKVDQKINIAKLHTVLSGLQMTSLAEGMEFFFNHLKNQQN